MPNDEQTELLRQIHWEVGREHRERLWKIWGNVALFLVVLGYFQYASCRFAADQQVEQKRRAEQDAVAVATKAANDAKRVTGPIDDGLPLQLHWYGESKTPAGRFAFQNHCSVYVATGPLDRAVLLKLAARVFACANDDPQYRDKFRYWQVRVVKSLDGFEDAVESSSGMGLVFYDDAETLATISFDRALGRCFLSTPSTNGEWNTKTEITDRDLISWPW